MSKKLLAMLLTVVMVMALLPVTALAADTSGSCGDGVTYSYSDGILTIEGTGSMDDYKMMGFGPRPWEDYSGDIHTVVIGDGVTYMGTVAFDDFENLTSATIGNDVVNISYAAFQGCANLTSVTMGNSVSFIDEWAFNMCTSLTSLTIPASVTIIGGNAFRGCGSLTDIYYGGSESQWNQIFAYMDIYQAFGFYVDEDEAPPTLPTIHYNSTGPDQSAESNQPTTPTTPATNAVLSPQGLKVDGKEIDCEKYNIADRNYFKLRDLAQLLSGTGSQFEVGYDEATATVSITTGKPYTPNGTELLAGVDNSASAQPSNQAILINGEKNEELTVYNIGGSNFFQLRELGSILGFEVDYDQDTNTAIVNSVKK